uniref:Nad-dependent deacetylase sirtuin-2 n=1 Tax=Colletotrichum fructicola (strain Nara gc5) TaxID=1213859 RepID=L2FS49_COLFN
MGNEESTMLDDSVQPKTLESRSLGAIADYIKSGEVKRIAVMTGAGISTAAGIPDFRSPGTGLYANLARLNLPYAEAVFDISYFRKHPEPFYYLAKELYPGKFFPTVSHVFIALLAKKGLLQMNFTQNIDCLERRAGVPDDKIIEAHGSFATQRCIECATPFPDDKMLQHVQAEIVPRCGTCDGLVKPDIVFFGEALPEAFRNNTHLPAMADLIVVMGTSLSVYPFAGLAEASRSGVPRLLLNRERVGQMGRRADDVVELGTCDAGVRKLASLLGWRDELEDMWRGIDGGSDTEDAQQTIPKGTVSRVTKALEAEVGTDIKDDRGREGHTVSGSEGAPQEATDFRAEAKKKIQLAAQGAATPLDEVAVVFDPNAPVAAKKDTAADEALTSGPARYEPTTSSEPATTSESTPADTPSTSSKETQDVPTTTDKTAEAAPPKALEAEEKKTPDDAKL